MYIQFSVLQRIDGEMISQTVRLASLIDRRYRSYVCTDQCSVLYRGSRLVYIKIQLYAYELMITCIYNKFMHVLSMSELFSSFSISRNSGAFQCKRIRCFLCNRKILFSYDCLLPNCVYLQIHTCVTLQLFCCWVVPVETNISFSLYLHSLSNFGGV